MDSSMVMAIGASVITFGVLGYVARKLLEQVDKDLEWLNYSSLWSPEDSSKKKGRK